MAWWCCRKCSRQSRRFTTAPPAASPPTQRPFPPLLEEKAYSQVMLAQAQNADTRLTRRDIDMLLDRLQTANPESAQVAGTTDDEFRQKFAALARKKVGERPPEE